MADRRKEKDRREQQRRTATSPRAIDNSYNSGPYAIDYQKKRILLNGDPIKLSPKEYQLLQFFIRNRGTVLSTQELLINLWPSTTRLEPNDIKQYVYILRQKIEIDPKHPQRLTTQNGFGYCLE